MKLSVLNSNTHLIKYINDDLKVKLSYWKLLEILLF